VEEQDNRLVEQSCRLVEYCRSDYILNCYGSQGKPMRTCIFAGKQQAPRCGGVKEDFFKSLELANLLDTVTVDVELSVDVGMSTKTLSS
jgi:hypothetical protein